MACRPIAVSGGILVALIVTYASRDEFADRARPRHRRHRGRPHGRDAGGRSGGGAAHGRQLHGPGEVNGHEARFIFDTGASTVVLRAENAAALGFTPDSLDYSIPVSTANGAALAAPVVIDRLTIGADHGAQRARAHRPPGVLHANLLGMSFLERLGSYEVRGNRLILRGRESDG